MTFLSLSERKKLYDQGDKTQILAGLRSCLATHEPIPPWLEQAFKNAFDVAMASWEIKSWDEVFGSPWKKHARPTTARRKGKIGNEIYERVEEERRRPRKLRKPIDKKLFESIGKDFGVGGTVASQLYYERKKAAKELDDLLNFGVRLRPDKKR